MLNKIPSLPYSLLLQQQSEVVNSVTYQTSSWFPVSVTEYQH